MADISRSDQIVHRFYVKTLGGLADARSRRERTDELKLDKWVSWAWKLDELSGAYCDADSLICLFQITHTSGKNSRRIAISLSNPTCRRSHRPRYQALGMDRHRPVMYHGHQRRLSWFRSCLIPPRFRQDSVCTGETLRPVKLSRCRLKILARASRGGRMTMHRGESH